MQGCFLLQIRGRMQSFPVYLCTHSKCDLFEPRDVRPHFPSIIWWFFGENFAETETIRARLLKQRWFFPCHAQWFMNRHFFSFSFSLCQSGSLLKPQTKLLYYLSFLKKKSWNEVYLGKRKACLSFEFRRDDEVVEMDPSYLSLHSRLHHHHTTRVCTYPSFAVHGSWNYVCERLRVLPLFRKKGQTHGLAPFSVFKGFKWKKLRQGMFGMSPKTKRCVILSDDVKNENSIFTSR